jgi:hypothetical protein
VVVKAVKTDVTLAISAFLLAVAGGVSSGCVRSCEVPSYTVKVIRPDGTVHSKRVIKSLGVPDPEPREGCVVVDCFGEPDIVAPSGWVIEVSPYGYYPPLPRTSPEAAE